MITLFTIPKAFHGHNGIIQRNAISSWLKLIPRVEVVLFGDDPGVSDFANELGVKHIPNIVRNEYGTPLLSSIFETIEQIANNSLLCYINADIILLQNFIDTIKIIESQRFVVSGRRYDMEINEIIDMTSLSWQSQLLADVELNGILHGYSGKDYFVYGKNMVKMPDFAVGRPGWDDWFIYHVRCQGIPVIDATDAITVIHQNHNYSHSKFGEAIRVAGPEWKINTKIAGGPQNMMTLRDADYIICKEKCVRPPVLRRILSTLSMFYLWRMLLGVKRRIQSPDCY